MSWPLSKRWRCYGVHRSDENILFWSFLPRTNEWNGEKQQCWRQIPQYDRKWQQNKFSNFDWALNLPFTKYKFWETLFYQIAVSQISLAFCLHVTIFLRGKNMSISKYVKCKIYMAMYMQNVLELYVWNLLRQSYENTLAFQTVLF